MVSKLEKIIEKGGNIVKLGLMGFGLLLSNSDLKADVLLYPTVETFDTHVQTNRLVVGQQYLLKIWADNTRETNKTVGFQWTINAQFDIPQNSIPQPNPWYSGDLGPDFFESFDMEKDRNFVRLNESFRITKEPFRQGIPLPRDGPTNKIGVVGLSYFTPIKNDSDLKIISIFSKRTYDPSGSFDNLQSTRTKKLPLAVVPENQTSPVLLYNPNEREHNQVYVACPPNQRVILETSTNLKDWMPIYTNSPAGESFWYNYANSGGSTEKFFRTRNVK